MDSNSPLGASSRTAPIGYVLVAVALSLAWESIFVLRGSNALDEGWPLYTAMQLHAGGALYRDVFWVFPPGHLLAAWVAWWIDPPGVQIARCIYGAFSVALVAALYRLGCQLMPPAFALLAACMLALAAPLSHLIQAVFGYRYLIFSVLALLCLARNLRTDDRRWLVLSGACVGIGVLFRVSPSFAVCCGLGAATVASASSWREWLRDVAALALGFLVISLPAVGWLMWDVGGATLFREVIRHPVTMYQLQHFPLPPLHWPAQLDRESIAAAYLALAFRLYGLLYLVYAAGLALHWGRARRAKRPFEHPLLLAVVVWGGVFYLRALGRADEPHLDSVIAPVCLLVADAFSRGFATVAARSGWDALWQGRLRLATVVLVLGAWIFLLNDDHQLEGVRLLRFWPPPRVTQGVEVILRHTQPDDVILDLSAQPLFLALTGRRGPGYADMIMPGTFFTSEHEEAFLQRLQQEPPEAVLWPLKPFDDMEARAVGRTAPLVVGWVKDRYRPAESTAKFLLLTRRP